MTVKKKTQKGKRAQKNLETDVFNMNGESIGKVRLPPEIFNAKINPLLMAQAVRVFLANKRSGTHAVKTRSQVRGSTRKIYRQKGTGRARHGDVKAPIFIGGGVAHGPHPKDYSLDMPRKMRRMALFSALSDKFNEGKLKVINNLNELPSKTRNLVDTITKLKIVYKNKKNFPKVLLIMDQKKDNVILAGRNIENLTLIHASLLNTYEVMVNSELIIMKDAIEQLIGTFLKKNSKKDKDTKIETNKEKKIDVKSLKTIEVKAKDNKKQKSGTVKKRVKNTNTLKTERPNKV
ncbi:50S ribosomal protein L4 [Candidatus Gottesmanbacteria bacterium CG11_big_fil_rev_8_21_14_0_20_37_11]|uniref:Large ribosomal subunit protein uL4 n=3 Tax=Candidatus Gottesmaniibacteriota TaxID=1752720 RepID=A0A2M7RQP3_9BACT|nr:MAG: 50S ribosomal protein L4 [Candidatus Gottesmanbacteria bacterium CG1_02_37_22]PIP32612.1 MAG: 50S ribosomal protein L4 [Candidatus Gottesmanbacteria bacterium CG23_combo_of_CG06-09_8_20_14_all_37_19]PIR08488.1 MAG: 50S ribosomal protein L4 [Candidatus Gottesmanbacteria bacterium CG11_big_fil_rev_8_21_14_0_20_37_11]PIZ02628.1 MAG: 50S ribosomal protein L4 [Candidatus Gottesmanbacteria bacterium CG_4_10_14_0_8_um_filter_37_24]